MSDLKFCVFLTFLRTVNEERISAGRLYLKTNLTLTTINKYTSLAKAASLIRFEKTGRAREMIITDDGLKLIEIGGRIVE
jgi:predicted transcriptional regulator